MDPVALISALGIGSAVGTALGSAFTQAFTGGKERRETRSAVLAHLTDAETARWAPEHQRDEYTQAIRQLEASALVAGVPRNVIALYRVMSHTARNVSEQDVEEDPINPDSGEIDPLFADLVMQSAELIRDALWSPITSRKNRNKTIARIRQTAYESKMSSAYISIAKYFNYGIEN